MSINFSTSLASYRWRPTAWLRVTGSDAETFLQGQFTNELRGLGGESGAVSVYGLWLDVKGKVLADSFVLRGSAGGTASAEFWIGSYFSPAAVIQARLESHVIADDVIIEDATAGWMGVSVLGSGAGAWLRDQQRASPDVTAGFVFPGRRTLPENAEWIFPAEASDVVWRQLTGLTELNTAEMERRRIRAGLPAVPADVGPGDLPNEGGLETEAISYTKGCYLGQEVMARLKSMGKVRRRLMRVRGSSMEFPPLPAPLFVGERQVGELRSAVREAGDGFIGLAMFALMHVTPDAKLALTPGAVPTVNLVDVP